MKVTVCQLRDTEIELNKDWYSLVEHVKENKSDLVLLPEMPFYSWIAGSDNPLDQVKRESVKYHDLWSKRIQELAPAVVAYTRPEFSGNKFYNKAYIWQQSIGHYNVHTKYYLPDAPNFRETTWFDRYKPEMKAFSINGLNIGFLICTELWYSEMARAYSRQGVDLILCPRATGAGSIDPWVRGAQTAAFISGTYCLSSNRAGNDHRGYQWGGTGWIAEPLKGELLSTTNEKQPIITYEIDLQKAKDAKKSYPRTVEEYHSNNWPVE